MNSSWVIGIVIITVLAVPSCTGAAELFAPELVFSTSGQELVSNLTLDQAPGSISGYDITITLEPAGIAKITGVEYPAWAVLTQTSDLPGETVRIRAVNMQSSAVPAEGSVELARIIVVSSGQGTVTPGIAHAEVDDYSGNTVVSVTPLGTVPPVPGSEGGTGSISYTGQEVTGGTIIPSVTTLVTTASPVPTGGGVMAGDSGVAEQATRAEQPVGNVIEAAPTTTTPVPTTIPGPGPVTLACAGIFAAIMFSWKMKNN